MNTLSIKDAITRTVLLASLSFVDPFNSAFYKVMKHLGVSSDQQFNIRLNDEFKIKPYHIPKIRGDISPLRCYFILYSAYKGIELSSDMPRFVETEPQWLAYEPTINFSRTQYDEWFIYDEYFGYGHHNYTKYRDNSELWYAKYPDTRERIIKKGDAVAHDITKTYMEYCCKQEISTPFRLGVTPVSITTGKLNGHMRFDTCLIQASFHEDLKDSCKTYHCKLMERVENCEHVYYLHVYIEFSNTFEYTMDEFLAKHLVFKIYDLIDEPTWEYKVFTTDQGMKELPVFYSGQATDLSYTDCHQEDEELNGYYLVRYIASGCCNKTYIAKKGIFTTDDLLKIHRGCTFESDYSSSHYDVFDELDLESIISNW